MAFMARLIDKGEAVPPEQVSSIIYFGYKIFDNTNGTLVAQGSLNDKGEDGDEHAGDNIYTQTIKADHEGEYKAVVSAAGPTFSRQQIIPYNVSSGLVSIVKEPPNEFTHSPGGLFAELSSRSAALKKPELHMLAQMKGKQEILAIDLAPYLVAERKYRLPVETLAAGEYFLSVRLVGEDEERKKISAVSEKLEFTAAGTVAVVVPTPEAAQSPVEKEKDKTPQEKQAFWAMIWGLISWLVALAWSGSVTWWFYRGIDQEQPRREEKIEPYVMPKALAEQVESICQKASDTLRQPTDEDLALFAEVADLFEQISPSKKVKTSASRAAAAQTEPDANEIENRDASPAAADEAAQGEASPSSAAENGPPEDGEKE